MKSTIIEIARNKYIKSELDFQHLHFFQRRMVQHRLKYYKKFMIVRDPLQRLVTVFINKFINTPGDDFVNFRHVWSKYIMAFTRRQKNIRPIRRRLKFKEFMTYLTKDKSRKFQEHWMPFYHLCHPCLINYDWVAKLETLNDDSDHILKLIGAPESLKFPAADESTRNKTVDPYKDFISKIPQSLIQKVRDVYKTDYQLFGYR